MNLVFQILIVFGSQSHAMGTFSPQVLEREVLQRAAQDISALSELSISSVRRASLACQIELRDSMSPENCHDLIKIWGKSVKLPTSSLTADLNRIAEKIGKDSKIKEYIQSRSLQSGTDHE